MSLINDALKRASQTKLPAVKTAEPEPPLRPVEHRRAAHWPLLLLAPVLLILGLSIWLFLKGWEAQHRKNLLPHQVPVAARELPPTPQADATDKQKASQQPLASASASPSTAVTSSNQTNLPNQLSFSTNPPPPTHQPANLGFPAVRLQGVFYRPASPSAVINGRTVSIRGKVAGATVVDITRDSVTLEWNGETKVLTLE